MGSLQDRGRELLALGLCDTLEPWERCSWGPVGHRTRCLLGPAGSLARGAGDGAHRDSEHAPGALGRWEGIGGTAWQTGCAAMA